MSDFLDRLWRISAFPITLTSATGVSMAFNLLIFLFWIPAFVISRRRMESFSLPPWKQGWLFRLMLLLYIPVFAALLFIVEKFSIDSFPDSWLYLIPTPVILSILSSIALLGVSIRKLYKEYKAHRAERISIWRFIFKAPASVKAWTRKYLMAALGAQILFLGCCFLLLTIIYKPVLGVHPWQKYRFPVGSFTEEAREARRITANLQRVYIQEFGSNKDRGRIVQ